MAKKKSTIAKSPAARKTRKPSAKPASKKSPPRQHKHRGEPEEEIELDETESKAVDHIIECDQARDALEREVDKVVTQAVRKICKAHGQSLTDAQAQNVAMVLFGD